MQTITRKALAVLLSVLLLCAVLPMAVVSAADDILNKDFEDGNTFFSSDCPLEVVQENGSNVLHWDASGADWANIYVYTGVDANTDYKVTYKMKANMASGLTVKFLAPDWMSAYGQASASVSTEWTDYEVVLNSGNGGTVVFMIQTGLPASAGQQIYVDNVVLTKNDTTTEPDTPVIPDTPDEPYVPVDGNYFTNGAFETGNADGWKLHGQTKVDATAAKTGGYGLHIKGSGDWGGLGNQTISGLEIGKTYRISLWYKALSNGVNIQLCEGTSDAGAKLAYIYGTKTEWTEFAVEFEATTTSVFFTLVGAGNYQATEMYMDDISLTEVVLGGNDNDPNLKMIDTLVDRVKTQGRTSLVKGTLMLDFSISGMEFELDCAGDVYATFNVRKLSSSSADGGLYFTIIVDGQKLARDYCHISSVGETKVKLASDLPAGKHTFAIYRQSEHHFGEAGVCALSYEGEMLDKPADKDLYIEFIGDSISCGFGNLGNASQGDGAALWSDGTQAYTYLTANALNADWSNVAWSGIGCKYGYGSITMQDVYPVQRYNYDQTTLYDFSKQPDIVILALGTNDNSIQSNATLKREGLKEMLTLVREKNPTAPIVWIHGMMTTGVSAMIEEIVAEFGGADAGYYACRLTQNNAGGGSHPNLAGQQTFANELVAFIEANGLADGTDAPIVPDEPDEPIIPDEPVVSGAIITGGETSRTEESETGLGLAFKFDVNADGIGVKNVNVVDYTNATVTIDGTAYKLVDMGAVMSNDTSVGLNADLLTLDNLSGRTIQIQTKYLMTWGEEGISYAVRIINIPVENEDTIIYARPYYTVEMDGKPVTVYGDIYKDNYVGKIDVNDGVLEW